MSTAMARFKEFTIKAEYIGDKEAPWSGDNGHESNWNNHRVTVRNREIGHQRSFQFWASIMHPELRSRSDLLNAFECFLSDAISGSSDFYEFCNELGYDNDSRKAHETWKECGKQLEKAEAILGNWDLYDLANALQEAL